MEKNYTDDELEIKFKEILEYYKSMYSPTENPKVTLLGGQPGAGKSGLENLINIKKNYVSISGDDYREYHPRFKEINLEHGREASKYTQQWAAEITEKLIRSSAVDLVVVDSVAALVPKAEIEGNMGDSHMALQARLMSQALRKIAGQMNKTNTTVIFINQIREKVGVLYGSPEVTPGGRALKFYSSVRIDIRKADKILESGVMVGNKTKVKIVKNKVAAPFKEVMLTMRYGKGLDTEGDIINLAIDFGVVEKAGSWFSYNGERIGQGRDKVREYMESNPDKKEEIEEKVKQMARENTSYGMMEDDDDDSVDTDTTEE